MSRQPRPEPRPQKRASIWRRCLATLRSALSWTCSLPRKLAARREQRRRLKALLLLKPVLLVLQAQQDRLDRVESLLLQVARLAEQAANPPLEPLRSVATDQQLQGVLLMEQRELLLEVLQAMQPPAEDQLSLLIGQPSLPSSSPSSAS